MGGGDASDSYQIRQCRRPVDRPPRLLPGVRIVGTTITSEVGAAGNGGTAAAAAERIELNQFIKTSGLFDDVADFYAVTTDPVTGAMKAQFIPNTSIGGAGDEYVNAIREATPREGLVRVDADTAISPGSFEAALRAAPVARRGTRAGSARGRSYRASASTRELWGERGASAP